MKRPSEEERLIKLGLKPNEARILFGLGLEADRFQNITMTELIELLSVQRPAVRQAILAKRRMVALRNSFTQIDKEYWKELRRDIGIKFVDAGIPFWFPFRATRTEVLQIPGVGKRTFESVVFLRSYSDLLLHEYFQGVPYTLNHLLVTPTITKQEPDAVNTLSAILVNHFFEMLEPIEGEFGWVPCNDDVLPEEMSWQVIDSLRPESHNHVAIYYPDPITEETSSFIDEVIGRIMAFSPIPCSIEVFGNRKSVVRFPLPLPETLRFEMVRSKTGFVSGIIAIPTRYEWELFSQLEKAMPLVHGGKQYTIADLSLLRMRLIISELES